MCLKRSLWRCKNISPSGLSVFQNDYYNKKVKDVILSVKPSPFYEGMNAKDMLFRVYLGYQNYEDLDIYNGFHIKYNRDIFGIIIDLDK